MCATPRARVSRAPPSRQVLAKSGSSSFHLPGASPIGTLASVSPDELMFGPTFWDFLRLVRRRFGGSGTRMDVRCAVLVGSFRAARLPARYNFSRDPC